MSLTGRGEAPRRRARRRTYFFLSYAHSAPVYPEARAEPEEWVTRFFEDLSAEVGRHTLNPGLEAGFYDQMLPWDADWKAQLVEALSGAEVFVPLYSPSYLGNPWPMRERSSFRGRLVTAPGRNRHDHEIPVLWIPFPSWDQPPDVEAALALGEGIPEYADNGLRALCMLAYFEDQYHEITRRLAGRIVTAVHRTPLGVSAAAPLDDVTVDIDLTDAFAVAVLAAGPRWRPFGHHDLPVADYAANTAERLGLTTQVVAFRWSVGLFERRPALLLIDPWAVADPAGMTRLGAFVGELPEWVIPVVVTDQDDPRYAGGGAALVDETVAMLSDARGRPRDRIRVDRVKDLIELMPKLINEARRNYLRFGPVFPPKDGATRRRQLSVRDSLDDD